MYAFSIFEPFNYFERSSIKRAFSSHIIILVRNLQGRNQSLYTCLFLPLCIYAYVYINIYEQKPSKAILLDHLAETFFILSIFRSSRPEVFLGKSVLKICSKFTGEHPYIGVNLPHIFRTPFLKKSSGRLLLNLLRFISNQH